MCRARRRATPCRQPGTCRRDISARPGSQCRRRPTPSALRPDSEPEPWPFPAGCKREASQDDSDRPRSARPSTASGSAADHPQRASWGSNGVAGRGQGARDGGIVLARPRSLARRSAATAPVPPVGRLHLSARGTADNGMGAVNAGLRPDGGSQASRREPGCTRCVIRRPRGSSIAGKFLATFLLQGASCQRRAPNVTGDGGGPCGGLRPEVSSSDVHPRRRDEQILDAAAVGRYNENGCINFDVQPEQIAMCTAESTSGSRARAVALGCGGGRVPCCGSAGSSESRNTRHTAQCWTWSVFGSTTACCTDWASTQTQTSQA
jgi:hypothetical protein